MPSLISLIDQLQTDLARAATTTAAIARAVRSLEAGGSLYPVRLRTVLEVVAASFGVAPTEVASRNRQQTLVTARHVAVYLAHQLLPGAEPADMAACFHISRDGLRYALAAVRDRLSVDAEFARQVEVTADQCRSALALISPPSIPSPT